MLNAELKPLKFKAHQTFDNVSDVAKLRSALNAAGYDATDDSIRCAWHVASGGEGGWYSVSGDESNLISLLKYLEPV